MQSFLKWNTVKFRGTCSISFKFFLQEWNRSCCRPCSSGCLQPLHRSLSFPPWPGSQAAQAHQGWRARAPGISTGSGGAVSQQSNNSSAGPGWRGRTGFCEHTWSDRCTMASAWPGHEWTTTVSLIGTRDLMDLLLEHSIFHKEDCNKARNNFR